MDYIDKKYPLAQLLEKGTGPFLNNYDNSLSYSELRSVVSRIGGQLATAGIGPGDPVAVVTPNGPEAAIIFLSVASFATAAPLNPSYTRDEFKFYLKDLQTKVLIVLENDRSESVTAANELNIKVLKLQTRNLLKNTSLIDNNEIIKISDGTFNQAEDVSLVLHTSGTTSRPKIVPLNAKNISVSAGNIARALELTGQDCYLNIMPLFHIHGLIAGVLATVESGGSMFCTKGFDALKFFNLLAEVKPSWYSAVPTMHQAILSRASRNEKTIENNKLKFIRSSSASLPTSVLEKLESVFGCPVIEAYGMTEASHQMTSNPLPPLTKKVGTVGIAAGPIVGILSDKGKILAANQVGEIVIKGENVTSGYKNNTKANAENFVNGWFRTGDQGFLDEDGFLTINGRLKEIINRGGEKISPKEVDEVLLGHPNVGQAVSFSIPHEKLGEEIGAAVVLIDPEKTTITELRKYLKPRIASFKIPKNIIFLSEIPKGSTGKVQRIGLAKKLGIIK